MRPRHRLGEKELGTAVRALGFNELTATAVVGISKKKYALIDRLSAVDMLTQTTKRRKKFPKAALTENTYVSKVTIDDP